MNLHVFRFFFILFQICIESRGNNGYGRSIRWLLLTVAMSSAMMSIQLYVLHPALLCSAVLLQLCVLLYRRHHKVAAG